MEGDYKRVIDRICVDLGLPPGDAFTQDWAYELPAQFKTRALKENETTGLDAWTTLVPVLSGNPALHRDPLEYWALEGEDLEDAFALTPHVRTLVAALYGEASGAS